MPLDHERAAEIIAQVRAFYDAGRFSEAGDMILHHILPDSPEDPVANLVLVDVLMHLHRVDDAQAIVERMRKAHPTDKRFSIVAGSLFYQQKNPIASIASMSNAIAIGGGFAQTYQIRSAALSYLMRTEDAIADSRTAVELEPDADQYWTTWLYVLSYHPTMPAKEIAAEFRRWGARQTHLLPPVGWDVVPDPDRRLRVGYVSPDFRNHTSRFYYEPLFEHHDRHNVELFAYATLPVPDHVTQRFRANFDHWRNVTGLSDEDVAKVVRLDRIDILVDGTNHMAGNRLGVFARKPAPIQVTWLGSIWTSGLEAMDYTLQDPYMVPPGADPLFTERVYRLPDSLFCFRPHPEIIEPSPPPCLINGYITFGYCGRTERLNDRVLTVWGRILAALPTARLELDFPVFVDPANKEYFLRQFERCGADISRVSLVHTQPVTAALARIDVMLDSFPHSGGTMLFDALWQGVPFITLADRPPCGRIGTGLLANLDLGWFVAGTEDEYVEKAAAIPRLIFELPALRAGMRDRMRASALMDEHAFAAGVDAAYRAMWRALCATQDETTTVPKGDTEGDIGLWWTRRMRRQGMFADALAVSRGTLAREPDSPKAMLAVIEALLDCGELAEADPLIETLLSRADKPHGVWAAKARLRLAEGNHLQAFEPLYNAQKEQPLEPAPLVMEAQGRLLMSDIAGAHQACARGLALHPDDPMGLGTLGVIRLMQGRTKAAEALFQRSLIMAPLAETLLALAWMYGAQAKLGEMRVAAQWVLALKPHYRIAANMIEMVDRQSAEASDKAA